MAIKLFVFSLLIISVTLLTVTTIFTNIPLSKKTKELPSITFLDSIMYDINDKEVTQVVQSQKALHYENKDELFDATIVLKSQESKEILTDTITSKYILKKGNQLTFLNNVIFNRDNEFILTTPLLNYNIVSQIGKNSHKFHIKNSNNSLVGENLYFDGKDGIIRSNRAKFKLETEGK